VVAEAGAVLKTKPPSAWIEYVGKGSSGWRKAVKKLADDKLMPPIKVRSVVINIYQDKMNADKVWRCRLTPG